MALITRMLLVIPALNPYIHNVPGIIKVTNFNLEGCTGETYPEMRLPYLTFLLPVLFSTVGFAIFVPRLK